MSFLLVEDAMEHDRYSGVTTEFNLFLDEFCKKIKVNS
jgi:hypothetical protein